MELELAVETYVVAENLHKWHFTDHKSPMIWPDIELVTLGNRQVYTSFSSQQWSVPCIETSVMLCLMIYGIHVYACKIWSFHGE
jgi:hypothetical protein